jgi:hypothetical protein
MNLPTALHALLGDASLDEDRYPLVSRDELIAETIARIGRMLPDARLRAPFFTPGGRVDIAVFDRSIALGVLVDGSDRVGAARTGAGTEGFDYTIALGAFPNDRALLDKPSHVWSFCVAWSQHGLRFMLARPGSRDAPHERAEPLLAILPNAARRRLARGRGRALDGLRDPCDARLCLVEAASATARDPIAGGCDIVDALQRCVAARDMQASVVRELAIGGAVADLAVLSRDSLELYEIKGATDSPARLARQVKAYDAIATRCTLVIAANHRSFRARVPAHWGLVEASPARDEMRFVTLRSAAPNPHAEPGAMIALLARGDLESIARRIGYRNVTHRSTNELIARLAGEIGSSCMMTLALRAAALRKGARLGNERWPALASLVARRAPAEPLFPSPLFT